MFQYECCGDSDEHQNGDQLYKDDGGVEVRRFLDADDQDGGDGQDGEKSNQIEFGGGVGSRGKLRGWSDSG